MPASDAEVEELRREVAVWRSSATGRWADAVISSRVERELRDELSDARVELAGLAEQLRLARSEAANLRKQIDDILGSTSWRVTRPIRLASQSIQRARQER
jgi:hypothetical protein